MRQIFRFILLSSLCPVFFVFVPNFIIKISVILLFTLHITKNIACYVTEVLIFYADKDMVMGHSKICVCLISRSTQIAKILCSRNIRFFAVCNFDQPPQMK